MQIYLYLFEYVCAITPSTYQFSGLDNQACYAIYWYCDQYRLIFVLDLQQATVGDNFRNSNPMEYRWAATRGKIRAWRDRGETGNEVC